MALKAMKLFSTVLYEGWWTKGRSDKKPKWAQVRLKGDSLEIEIAGSKFRTGKARLFTQSIDTILFECYDKMPEQR